MSPREFHNNISSSTSSVSPGNKNNNNNNNNHSNNNKTQQQQQGYYLRWSRIEKSVVIKNTEAGGLTGGKSLSTSFRSSAATTTENTTTTTNDSGGGKKEKKEILKGISAYAAPGEILALMGPSGSGKTSLLNVVSGRSTYQHGSLSINGRPVTPATMKRLMSQIAYVKQADIFFEHLTVRDQLTYTALLRLNHATTAEKIADVDQIIQQLRLTKVADSPIRLCSGGEKKRVNIASEVLTSPAVIILDEPTSGLDSSSAVALLKLLSTFARDYGKTVLTSIHQPSSAVFRSFDRLLMLSEGQVVYFGTPVMSLEYLKSQNLQCPDGYNAADHWMDLLVQDSAIAEENDDDDNDDDDDNNNSESNHNDSTRRSTTPKERPRLILERAWDDAAVAEQMEAEMDTALNASEHTAASTAAAAATTTTEEQANTSKYNTTWTNQYYILTHRALKNSRSAIFTPLNLIKSLALGLVAGLLWFQTEYTEQNVNDIRSFYFFTMTFWVFDAMFTALTAFPSERTVIMKERSSGAYHLSAYFMAKTTADAPVRVLLPFLYMIVSFWMAGISTDFSVFLGSIGCTLLSVLAGEAIGLFIGAAVYDLQKGLTIMTVFTLFLMLLGGFFVENIPPFLDWAKFLSPFKYAFDSSLQIVFHRPIPCDGSGALDELCAGADAADNQVLVSVEDLHEFIGIQGSVAFNVGMLLVLMFVLRIGAYWALRKKKEGER